MLRNLQKRRNTGLAIDIIKIVYYLILSTSQQQYFDKQQAQINTNFLTILHTGTLILLTTNGLTSLKLASEVGQAVPEIPYRLSIAVTATLFTSAPSGDNYRTATTVKKSLNSTIAVISSTVLMAS